MNDSVPFNVSPPTLPPPFPPLNVRFNNKENPIKIRIQVYGGLTGKGVFQLPNGQLNIESASHTFCYVDVSILNFICLFCLFLSPMGTQAVTRCGNILRTARNREPEVVSRTSQLDVALCHFTTALIIPREGRFHVLFFQTR